MNVKNRLYLFWRVGKYVFEKQKYYENAVSKYSALLSYHYGMSDTFSRENVRIMRNFYCAFPVFVSNMTKLNWEHYVLLLRIFDNVKRYFYLQIAIFCRSSVEELQYMIKNNFYDKL